MEYHCWACGESLNGAPYWVMIEGEYVPTCGKENGYGAKDLSLGSIKKHQKQN